jgi:hypothetical protein
MNLLGQIDYRKPSALSSMKKLPPFLDKSTHDSAELHP